MSIKRPSRFSPSPSYRPALREGPHNRKGSDGLIPKLQLLVSRLSSGIQVTRHDLVAICYKLDDIDDIITSAESKDSPCRKYKHVFDTTSPETMMISNEDSESIEDAAFTKCVKLGPKARYVRQDSRGQSPTGKPVGAMEAILRAEKALQLALQLQEDIRIAREPGGYLDADSETRFQHGGAHATPGSSSPVTADEAAFDAYPASWIDLESEKVDDVSAKQEDHWRIEGTTQAMSVPEPESPSNPSPCRTSSTAQTHQIAQQAEDLMLNLQSSLAELQARREEATHIQDLLTLRLESAAQTIFSLKHQLSARYISSFLLPFLPWYYTPSSSQRLVKRILTQHSSVATISELKFLRIKLHALEAQYRAHVPSGGDEELRTSIERWIGEWEILGGRNATAESVSDAASECV